MIKIGPYEIGTGRCFIIAEAGINHNGNVETAKKMIDAARECGADAVKFQSFKAEWLCNLDLKETKDVEALTGGTKSSYEMYKALELSDEAHAEIFQHAKKAGLLCFSSVFDPRTVDFLVPLNIPAIKISSGDLTHYPLIEKAAKTGLPVLISTGMATLSEVVDCYEFVSRMTSNCIFLHCVSEYPPLPNDLNLRVIPSLKVTLPCPVGFSDHSKSMAAALAAVSLGADVLEKHFTLDNQMDGPDQKLSTNPDDFTMLVKTVREIETALGTPFKQPSPAEWKGRFDGRRGIKAAKNLEAGHVLQAEDLAVIKPSSGLPPSKLSEVIGKTLLRKIQHGTPLTWNLLKE
ncbi:MAG: N-acetylneuraminate synthase family protein [Candidatus Aureabacteria bacterium]|nr:N-acetylneuraminate synthase family protein [Candidatus Auribacterota bacterium]